MKRNEIYRQVRGAIKSGYLIRPEKCQKCDKVPPKGSDGRATIHAHHADYSNPLDVEWLCAKCHRDITPLPPVIGAPVYGTKNGAAKLNPEAVKEIKASSLPSRKIAKIYGVDKSTILRVRRGIHWNAAAPVQEEK